MNKLFLMIAILAVACNNADNQSSAQHANGYAPTLATKEDSLFHDVMQGHDTGMARMGKLAAYEKMARQQSDSLKCLPANNKGVLSYINTLDSLSGTLREAENGMNRWMEEFQVDSEASNKELRIRYLEGEREKITKVNARIREALAQADAVLKNK